VTQGTDPLWVSAASRIGAARGWSLTLLKRLGGSREDRHTWLAQGEPGTVIVKALANPFASARSEWAAEARSALAGRGYPVPEVIWHGRLDDRWFLVVHQRLPGEPLSALDGPILDQLLALVDLQVDPPPVPGGWDVSWWISAVLFEGWEGWWEGAEAAAPKTTRRLREFLEPAWGYRLPVADVVHHDLNLTNVLAHLGTITGVVDWDDAGLGSRATDLTTLLFEWHRLRLAGEPAPARDGDDRLVRQIVQIAGDQGLRCTVAYGAIAWLALAAQRGEHDNLETARRVIEAILDTHPPDP
jgi:Ser/Thr protein kinase RdoA (MazF antagonist)